MSAENIPDDDSRKSFRLLDHVHAVNFGRDNRDAVQVEVVFERGPGETFHPQGNCYLLNEAGKVVASFGVAPVTGYDGGEIHQH